MALSAFIADRTGKAEDFFLPGLLLNAAYAGAYLVSIAIRWPLLGVILGADPRRGRAGARIPSGCASTRGRAGSGSGSSRCGSRSSCRSTCAGALLALGIAKTAMGLPIFLVAIWLSYLVLRESPDPREGEEARRMLSPD